MMRRWLLIAIGACGCVGGIDGAMSSEEPRAPSLPEGAAGRGGSSTPGPAPAPGGSTAGPTPSAPLPASCQVRATPAPLRRLTRHEYDNTVRDLLGLNTRPAEGFESDVQAAGFDTNSAVPPSRNLTEDYLDAAATLARQVDLARILPCDARSGDDACARRFIEDFGRRAFRRPLAASEVEALQRLHADKKARSDFAGGIRLVVQALLGAPSFLYRPDVAPAGPGRAYELASRLSYFLWSTMPDDKLFAAAQSGALLTRDGLQAEVRRMLADARAAATLRSFYEQWLDVPHLDVVDKDTKVFPQYVPALKAAMREEVRRFAEAVHAQDRGSLRALLTASRSYVDANLARVYGVTPAPAAFTRVELPAGQRSGILTTPAVMAVHSFATLPSPIHRGLLVRRRVLCQEVPPPQMGEIVPPRIDPNVSAKDRLAQHRADPSCAGCHRLMDPLGFGFQRYDAIGRWQTMDGKFAVDATGELTGAGEADGAFDGALELGQRLARSGAVQECMARQWFRFALGRMETAEEQCLIGELVRRAPNGDVDLGEVMFAVATSAAFVDSRTN